MLLIRSVRPYVAGHKCSSQSGAANQLIFFSVFALSSTDADAAAASPSPLALSYSTTVFHTFSAQY